jgi:hypothetical protein
VPAISEGKRLPGSGSTFKNPLDAKGARDAKGAISMKMDDIRPKTLKRKRRETTKILQAQVVYEAP